jgi:ParB-like chromosome segregation protein Spo0J
MLSPKMIAIPERREIPIANPVDRMCASIQEFGFAIPVLARSSGEVIDGHLRAKAARKMGSWPGGDTTRIPVIPCDGWTDAQVKEPMPWVIGGSSDQA